MPSTALCCRCLLLLPAPLAVLLAWITLVLVLVLVLHLRARAPPVAGFKAVAVLVDAVEAAPGAAAVVHVNLVAARAEPECKSLA